MRILLRSIFTLILAFGVDIAAEQGDAAKDDAAEARQCLEPWLESIDSIIAILKGRPVGKQLENYRRVLANGVLGKPDMAGATRAVRWISDVPDPSRGMRGTIGVVPICSEESTPPAWREYLRRSRFIAIYQFYGDHDGIVLRSTIPMPKIIRGIVLLHEMRHALQARNPIGSNRDPRYRKFREVDAYEFEFSVLDQLDLPEYAPFLHDEVKRIKAAYAADREVAPNLFDSRLERIFPDLGIELRQRETAAQIILVRAHFKMYEEGVSSDDAMEKKMELMPRLGHK